MKRECRTCRYSFPGPPGKCRLYHLAGTTVIDGWVAIQNMMTVKRATSKGGPCGPDLKSYAPVEVEAERPAVGAKLYAVDRDGVRRSDALNALRRAEFAHGIKLGKMRRYMPAPSDPAGFAGYEADVIEVRA